MGQLSQFYNWWLEPASPTRLTASINEVSDLLPEKANGNPLKHFHRQEFGPYHLPDILSFLEPQDLAHMSRVCKLFAQIIDETDQWKKQCQMQLGLSLETDPKRYLPEGPSYKQSLLCMFANNILDARVYERYIGKIGPVPRIPQELSLKRWNNPDPCAPTQRIGDNYVWMWIPSHIEITERGFSLDDQQAFAQANGVVISKLLVRILFNILEHTRSSANVYPDGQSPWTYARTATLTNNVPMGCGVAGTRGLYVSNQYTNLVSVGVAVELSSNDIRSGKNATIPH